MSSPYSMEIISSVWFRDEYCAIPQPGAYRAVKIGRGDAPTIWPVDISNLLAVSWEQIGTAGTPIYRWPAAREASFTLQAIEGAADVDTIRYWAAASSQGGWPLQITVYHGENPFTAFANITGITPQSFEWKDGNVLLEVRAAIVSPWCKLAAHLTEGGTFELGGDMPADVVYSIGASGTAGGFTIESSGGTPWANTYDASGAVRADSTRRWYPAGGTGFAFRQGGAAGSGSYYLERVPRRPSGNPYTVTTRGRFNYLYVIDNYSQPVWSV